MCVIRLVSIYEFFKELYPVARELLEVVRCVIVVYTKKYPNHTYIKEIAEGVLVTLLCWLLSSMLQFLFCRVFSFCSIICFKLI